MNINLHKILRISLLIMFLSIAPVAILSQEDKESTVKGIDPPSAKNSMESQDGRIHWRYHLQNRDFSELEGLIKKYVVGYIDQLSSKKNWNKYIYYKEQNAILFTLEKQYVEFVRKFMNKIDAPRSQASIYAQVVSITYEKETQVGWELSHDISLKSGNSNVYYRGFEFSFHPDDFITALTENPPGTGSHYWAAQDDFLGSTIFFGTSGESLSRIGGLEGAYRLLAKTEKVRILARPFVTLEAGYSAKFETGEEVPVSTIKTVGSSTVVSTTFESVGIKLTIEALSIGVDSVEMNVKPEVSAVSRYFDPGGTFVKYPIIIRRNAQTNISIKSGEELVIGGLKSDRSLVNGTGVPILSDIPLIGYLFRANRKEVKRQDIVFSITPIIVKPGEVPTHIKSNMSSDDWTITK